MSSFAAAWRLDGGPIESSTLEVVADRLVTRHADAVTTWAGGPVGLAHADLRTTPDAVHDTWPIVSGDGVAVLVADVRIDNRADLIAELGLRDRAAQGIGDGAILLAAWERWEEGCPAKLTGDFAFVVWDARRKRLFCARDQIGARPLYYHLGPNLFAAASNVRALLAVPGVPRQIDEVSIAAFLVPGFNDRVRTSYEGVLRLQAGHSLTVSSSGGTPRAYFQLDPSRELPPASDAEYAEEYRRLLTDAVRCRLRSTTPVAAALSGGLDSSSVVCVARTVQTPEWVGQLRTYTARFPSIPAADEGPYVAAVVRQGGVIATELPGDSFDPLGDFETSDGRCDEAFYGLGYYMHDVLYAAAKADGARVFLEGMVGDTVSSSGIGRLYDLALRRRLLPLWREARQVAAWTGQSPVRLVRQALSASAPPVLARALLRRLTRGAAALHPIRADFARRTQLADRLQASRRTGWLDGIEPARGEQWRALMSGQVAGAMESLATMGSAAGISVRDPFSDRRLVEYCLALPSAQRVRRGQTRVVAHHAMSSLFPPELRGRGRKASLELMFGPALTVYGRDRLALLMRDAETLLEPWVPVESVRFAYRAWLAGNTPSNQKRLWRLASLALWLRKSGLREVVAIR